MGLGGIVVSEGVPCGRPEATILGCGGGDGGLVPHSLGCHFASAGCDANGVVYGYSDPILGWLPARDRRKRDVVRTLR